MNGAGTTAGRPARALLELAAGAAAFGFAIGAGKNLTYAWRSAVKMPLLLLGTAVLCGLAYQVTALALGHRLDVRRVQAAAFELFRGTAVLLSALAPVSLFLGRTMASPGDDGLGGYTGFVAVNMLFLAVAGALALRRQARTLLGGGDVPRSRALAISGCWLLLTLAVGGQLAFWLRPFFGITSLTGDPPFLLGSAPTATGARNFYEVVWQFATGPDLEVWRRWYPR
ncbi:MAG TPA: hypothetical protein VF384_07275 [Planctomycetota bacterium]